MRKNRAVASIMAATTALLLALVLAPAASAATLELRWVSSQPQDAKVGATIKTADLNTAGGALQIGVFDTATDALVTNFSKKIGFVLQTGDGFASGSLSVTPQVPVNGIATFGEGTISIGTENEPQFTDYALVPVTTQGQFITGPASAGFNVWEDGNACDGGATGGLPNACSASLRGGKETYGLTAAGSLGASELFDELPGLTCPGQKVIFDDRIYSYATTESDGVPNSPVMLTLEVTKQDWKAAAQNGQAHADLCIGLVSQAAWAASGATPTQVDTDLDEIKDLWVAIAPKCPSANASASAPCYVSQTSNGAGGSITVAWLPGGDPPRRT
jgi:hypothetical protein